MQHVERPAPMLLAMYFVAAQEIEENAALIEDASTRAAIFADAKHMPHPSEIAFELWLERVMHTRWEHPLTPQMRPVHQKWRAPRSG